MQADVKQNVADYAAEVTNDTWQKVSQNFCMRVKARSGVEDTRLEAKDTKKSEAKDSLSEDRHSRGQGQECSRPRPRTQTQVLSKKKRRSSQKFFTRSPQKNVFQTIFQALHRILTIQKIVLSSSLGQANFRGLEVSRRRPRTSKCVLEDSTFGESMFQQK